MRRIVTLAIVMASCAPLSACGGSSSPTPPSRPSSRPSSPKAELAAMHKAARSQHSVHYVSVSSAPGHKIRIVSDVGATEGVQRIAVTDHDQTGTATVIVSNGAAYMRGSPLAMSAYFGLTTPQATKYAGKWIAVPSSNPGYATISGGVTFPSFLSQLFPTLTTPSLVTAGKLIGVRGIVKRPQDSITATTTIFAPAQGEPLPVKQTASSAGTNGASVVTMSNWGVAVHVPAPNGAVPIDTVVGG